MVDHQATQERLHPSPGDHAYHPLRLIAQALRTVGSALDAPVVDLGCGARPYALLLPAPYIGLDLQRLHGTPDVLARAEQVPLRGGSVRTVVSTQQLEHVDNPLAVLTEARRLLVPGGRLVLSTHGVWAHHPDPHDLWRWTEEGLATVIASAGFEVEHSHRLGGPVLAGVLLATYPLSGAARNGGRVVRTLASLLLRCVNAVVWPIDRTVERRAPRHYGSVGYVVVARAI